MSIERKEIVTCPKCSKESDYIIWESLNGDLNPEAKQELMDGTLFQFNCPHCGHQCNVDYGMLYHDMAHQAMVYYVSENSVEKTKKMFSDTDEKIGIPMPEYRKRIVTNQNALREKAIIFENELDDRVIELIKLFYLANAQERFPDANVVAAFFLIHDRKYIIQFIGDQSLSAEITAEFYKSIENEYADELAAAGDEQCIINAGWANKFLEE